MTPVRQAPAGTEGRRRRAQGAAAAPASGLGPSRLAQVRLRADEMVALRDVMRALNLSSTSDALREGLRLLAREAAEVSAVEKIRAFYGGDQAPPPDGTDAPSADELAAADKSRW